MTQETKAYRLLSLAIVFIALSSVEQWLRVKISLTALWWVVDAVVLAVFVYLWPRKGKRFYSVPIVNVFLLVVLISSVYGAVFQTEYYWDWKNLVNNLLIFMLPLAVYAYSRPIVLVYTLRSYLRFAPVLLVPVLLLVKADGVARFLSPFSFLALMYPYLAKKCRIMVIVAFFLTLVFGYESRSDILKFFICLSTGLLSCLPNFKTVLKTIAAPLYGFLMVLPVVLIGLAAAGIFNIFNLDEELGLNGKVQMKAEYYESGEASALSDTRSFIYLEQIQSAVEHNYVIFGRSPARGYDSEFFGNKIDQDLGISRGERADCEVSILNIFNYFGIVGVIIYFLIFAFASFKAIFRSKNVMMPVVGLYVAFRWCFAWIEDFTRFDLNYLFLWIMMAMCFSPAFRNFSRPEIIFKGNGNNKVNTQGY